MFNISNIVEAVDNYAETYAETNNQKDREQAKQKIYTELSKVYTELDRYKKSLESIISGD